MRAYSLFLIVFFLWINKGFGMPDPLWDPHLEERARHGEVVAQYLLGCGYSSGERFAKDEKKAVEWWTKAANQGDRDSQYFLGLFYSEGRGVGKNLSEAKKWYKKSATQGQVAAQYALAMIYYEEEGENQNRGRKVNMNRVIELLTQAANKDYFYAQEMLGNIYFNGILGVKKDYHQSVKWDSKAAYQKVCKESQYRLGIAYQKGYGVRKNDRKAIEWLTQSAEAGEKRAGYALGEWYETHNDMDKAFYWYKKIKHSYKMGVCYAQGWGTAQNMEKAVKYWRNAALNSDARAQYELGWCYYDARGVPRDEAKAVQWFKEACLQDDDRAQCALGMCYMSGHGVAKNAAKAVKYWLQSAQAGNALAQYNLGTCYDYGDGVSQDKKKAYDWYHKSAAQGNEHARAKLEAMRVPFEEIRAYEKARR